MRNNNSQISLGINFVGTHPCMRPMKDGHELQDGVYLGNISKNIPTGRDVPTVLPTISTAHNCKRKLPPQKNYCNVITYSNYLKINRLFALPATAGLVEAVFWIGN